MADKIKLEAKAETKIAWPQNADAGKVKLLPGQTLTVTYEIDGETFEGYEFTAPADLGNSTHVGVYNRVTAQPEGNIAAAKEPGVFEKSKR